MIRFIGIVIFLVCYLVVGIPILAIEKIRAKKDQKASDLRCLRRVQWAFGICLKIAGTDITVIGEENVPDEPVLFIANHRSYFDILVTYVRCKRLTGYVSKKEMLKYPLLRDQMRALYCLFLDRENIREGLKTILTAIDQIKAGISITIFPEGTRNTGEELSMLPFHEGSFKIATKTGCPIVPIGINNSAEIFENHLPRVKKCHIVIEYCKPIYPKELDKETLKHIGAYCQDIIQETINKNQSLV
ncbi:MAG: 1-acyl-sn-glycerol-3-phosphate acyltransferase [Dorea sp.]|nr:1-acyl-sn-glycerol-3-phosphate acyltransferase [Dorea sp.]